MEFTGWLEVPQSGQYMFFVESDDGALLYVGRPSLSITDLGSAEVTKPRPLALGKALSNQEEFHRCTVEGEVVRVEEQHRALRLDLRSGEFHLTVDIADAFGAPVRLLRGSRVRVTGICYGALALDGRRAAGLLWAPAWRQVEVVSVAPDRWAGQPLSAVTNLAARPRRAIRIRTRARAWTGALDWDQSVHRAGRRFRQPNCRVRPIAAPGRSER